MKRDAIIFDIDGTLADVTHRRHFVQTHPKNWKAFSEAMVLDKPNPAVEFIYRALCHYLTISYKYETDIIIVSGRSDEYRQKTEEWLLSRELYYDTLYMRKEGDYRDDSIVKGEIADEIEKTHNILFVFDDRPSVVRSWQKRGIWTFDVGQGCEDF